MNTFDQELLAPDVLEATRKWEGAEPVDDILYRVRLGPADSDPYPPAFRNPDDPDQPVGLIAAANDAGVDDRGGWVQVYLNSYPDEAHTYGLAYIGQCVELGEWAIRIVDANDDGATFALLAHPDLPPWE